MLAWVVTTASPEREKRHWEFPELEIPEAPLHHGGAPLGHSLSRDPEVPSHQGGDFRGQNLREGPQLALACARSRPTSVQTSWKGCGGPQQVSVCKKSTYI